MNEVIIETTVQIAATLLLEKSLLKMSDSAKNILASAGTGISAIIIGAGEAMIAQTKK